MQERIVFKTHSFTTILSSTVHNISSQRIICICWRYCQTGRTLFKIYFQLENPELSDVHSWNSNYPNCLKTAQKFPRTHYYVLQVKSEKNWQIFDCQFISISLNQQTCYKFMCFNIFYKYRHLNKLCN